MRDVLLPAALWPVLLKLDAVGQAAFLQLWPLADRDGICPLDREALGALVQDGSSLASPDPLEAWAPFEACLFVHGLLVCYVEDSLTAPRCWAWLPDVALHAPPPALRRPVEETWLPPPERSLRQLLEVRLSPRVPTEKEVRDACPRSFGRRRAAATPTDDLAAEVFRAWAANQDSPDRCVLTPAARKLIERAIPETGLVDREAADALLLLLRYVFEADEKGPRYLRENRYTGLDNILVHAKLQSRLALARAWADKVAPDPASPGGVDLGPLARFR